MRDGRFRLAVLLSVLTAAAGCSDAPVHPAAAEPQFAAAAADLSPGEAAARMRRALREMDDATLVSRVAQSRNVVVVGFREVGAFWGVDGVGRNLVSSAAIERRTREIAAHPGVGRIVHRFGLIPAVTVELRNAHAARALRALPWVDYVAFNSGDLTPDAVPLTPATSALAFAPQPIPWNIIRVRADDAWPIATGNISRYLSVLDDGADEGNEGSPGPDLGPWYIYLWWYLDNGWNTEGHHGTAVLSAAKARNNTVGTVGVAPDATATIDVIYNAAEGAAWESNAAAAIDYESRYGAAVITMSFSTKQTSPDPPASQTALYDVIRAAYNLRGVLITASTGNDAQPLYAYPARFAEVIGVGGSGYNDEWVFNNYGSGNVEIAAPAVDVEVLGKGGGTATASGTSYSTPMAAGALMLLRQRFPAISNDSIRARLRNTAVPMASTLRSGAGRMDVYAALTAGGSGGGGIDEPPPHCDPNLDPFCPM